MNDLAIDQRVLEDHWSNLRQYQPLPDIDFARLHAYRVDRMKSALRQSGAAMAVLVNPISLRYVVDYRSFSLFQTHIPTAYLFISAEGPLVLHGAYGESPLADEIRPGKPINFFDGGPNLDDGAQALAKDVLNYLSEIGTNNRRVAVDCLNPSITQALMEQNLEVIDAMPIAEEARLIKSADEIACMRWAVAVAEHGISMMKQALKPGVSELQLWGLLNYANLANNGDWHDGRMLASGPRINPWLQEASERRIEAGDLVGFDTDMIGPFGYFADISRTFYCGPGQPSKRQKQLYQLALKEIEYNLELIRPGLTLNEFQQQAFVQEEEFQQQAYVCLIHGVGMCDEYPRVNPIFRGPNPYNGTLEAGMVICVESYVGAAGERDGVKLEQQVLVTETGYDMLSTYPLEDNLLD